MTHTPGPWSLAAGTRSRRVYMQDDTVEIQNADGSIVAALYRENFGRNGMDEANARLIAAAPALLHACEQALMSLELDAEGTNYDSSAVIHLRAAIALAKGETNE